MKANNAIKTVVYKDFTINVFQDENAEAPNIWENTDLFLVYDHRQFSVKVKGFDPSDIFDFMEEKKGKGLFENEYWYFPVFAYIHSGVSLSLGNTNYPFNCKFDTSFKGFCLVKRQKNWSYTRKQAIKLAGLLVEEWNQYLHGEVYYYTITDKFGNNTDSCGGYYGDIDKNIIPECKTVIDSNINNNPLKYATQLELIF